jgi:hypothetical protein
MVTVDATMSALMSASGPMVNAFSWMSIVPSTWPSMVMSSELVNVPWNFTDLPTHAMTRRSSAGRGGLIGCTTGCMLGAAFGCSVALSRVHISLVPREWGAGTLVCLLETAPAASRIPAATVGQSVIRQRSTYRN